MSEKKASRELLDTKKVFHVALGIIKALEKVFFFNCIRDQGEWRVKKPFFHLFGFCSRHFENCKIRWKTRVNVGWLVWSRRHRELAPIRAVESLIGKVESRGCNVVGNLQGLSGKTSIEVVIVFTVIPINKFHNYAKFSSTRCHQHDYEWQTTSALHDWIANTENKSTVKFLIIKVFFFSSIFSLHVRTNWKLKNLFNQPRLNFLISYFTFCIKLI